MVASIGLFIYLLIVAFYVSEMEPPDMLGMGGGGKVEGRWRESGWEVEGRWKESSGEVEGRWRGGGGEVEGRWRESGGEVKGRWRDRLFQDLHVMFATGAIRN